MLQIVKLVCCVVLVLLVSRVAVADIIPSANWSRSEAARSAAVAGAGAAREELRRLAAAGGGAELLDLLRSTSNRADWPVPARESVLFEFIRDLRTMPPRSVAPEVMDYLHSYQPQVLVAHEDHPQTVVPMFNIRAAISGVENAWTSQETAYEGASLLARDPALLVEAFRVREDRAVRLGLVNALASANPGQLEAVCFLALDAIEEDAAMVELAGQAALLNGDARALEQLVRTGKGPSVPQILRQAANVFTTRQLGRLLDTAVYEGPPETASVAIAELAPALAGLPNHDESLLDLLGDPQLGSTAALALARNPTSTTLRRLNALAAVDDGSLRAARARLALNVNRTEFAREVRE